MKYIFGMTTIDRCDFGKANCIYETMNSLKNSGFWEQAVDYNFIIFDGGSKDLAFLSTFLHLDIGSAGKRVHIRDSHRLMLEHSIEKYSADIFVFLQDDIVFCKNWFVNLDLWLQQYHTQSIWAYSFFTPYREVSRSTERIWKYPTKSFYGNQCLAINYGHIESLIKKIKDKPHIGGSDMNIKEWLSENGQDYILASCPSIVQHQGRDSTLNHRDFQCGSFEGEDVDPKIYEVQK